MLYYQTTTSNFPSFSRRLCTSYHCLSSSTQMTLSLCCKPRKNPNHTTLGSSPCADCTAKSSEHRNLYGQKPNGFCGADSHIRLNIQTNQKVKKGELTSLAQIRPPPCRLWHQLVRRCLSTETHRRRRPSLLWL